MILDSLEKYIFNILFMYMALNWILQPKNDSLFNQWLLIKYKLTTTENGSPIINIQTKRTQLQRTNSSIFISQHIYFHSTCFLLSPTHLHLYQFTFTHTYTQLTHTHIYIYFIALTFCVFFFLLLIKLIHNLF